MFKKITQVSLMLVLCVVGIALSQNTYSISSTENEEISSVEELLIPDIINTTVSHSDDVTITFALNDQYSQAENVQVFIEANGIYSRATNNSLINNEFAYTFSVSNIGESIIEILITSNKYESTEEVYIYSTETVDYISTISMPSAKRLYFSDMYDLGLVTELDYNLIVYGDDYEADIEITPGYMSSTYLYIRGYIKFRNDTGTEYPAQDVTIDIYDDDPIIGYNLLKSIKTSSTGYYTTSVQNDSSWLENGTSSKKQFIEI